MTLSTAMRQVDEQAAETALNVIGEVIGASALNRSPVNVIQSIANVTRAFRNLLGAEHRFIMALEREQARANGHDVD